MHQILMQENALGRQEFLMGHFLESDDHFRAALASRKLSLEYQARHYKWPLFFRLRGLLPEASIAT
jgi:hypothetical protein